MIATMMFTMVSFVIIFVALNGWSSSAGAHAIIGCIVTGLMVINVLLAVARPAPGTGLSSIFLVYFACIHLTKFLFHHVEFHLVVPGG